MLIYMAVSVPTSKLYFGITSKSLEVRAAQHLASSKSPRTRFHKALRRYGKEGFQWYALGTASTLEEACTAERYLIEFFDTRNTELGYNGTRGGQGTPGRVVSEATRQKCRERRHSAETRTKMSAAHTGRTTWNKGKKLTAEQRRTRAGNQNRLGKKHTETARERISQACLRHSGSIRERMLGKRYSAKSETVVRQVLADVPILGVCATARKHGVHRSTVRLWVKTNR